MKLPLLTATRIPSRTDTDSFSDPGASHWRCTLYLGGKRMSVFYSMGSAHKNPPTALDVLGSLFSDSSCACESFAQFCDELGYDQDSRKGEAIYKACKSISVRLHKLLGSSYQELEAHCHEQGV